MTNGHSKTFQSRHAWINQSRPNEINEVFFLFQMTVLLLILSSCSLHLSAKVLRTVIKYPLVGLGVEYLLLFLFLKDLY